VLIWPFPSLVSSGLLRVYQSYLCMYSTNQVFV
jgi:hypothetical protein